ncbi:hypothetical protein KY339_02785 [Candidatus Woesearchaeota archaeon]|nr:hypothetical protein [Candidatus Woesearchaeota archaeon]
MNKKSQLTFNQIVLAVIALVVLVILILIFTGQIGKKGEAIEEVGEPVEAKASDTGWCLGTVLKGDKCEYEEATTCTEIKVEGRQAGPSTPKGGEYTCPENSLHVLAGKGKGINRFCCLI